jgi:hypothetical protein
MTSESGTAVYGPSKPLCTTKKYCVAEQTQRPQLPPNFHSPSPSATYRISPASRLYASALSAASIARTRPREPPRPASDPAPKTRIRNEPKLTNKSGINLNEFSNLHKKRTTGKNWKTKPKNLAGPQCQAPNGRLHGSHGGSRAQSVSCVQRSLNKPLCRYIAIDFRILFR